MDADRATREEKKKDLLRQLAELSVEEQVEAGLFLGTPHYSIIERVAVNLGRDLSRQQRRRLFEAPLRAFLGDGLNWNWSIWKRHFSTFVPILDFIHAIQYVYSAAMALSSDDVAGWTLYVKHVTMCWTGQVEQVIEELKSACWERGMDLSENIADDDPFKPVTDAVRYLGNNLNRMDYPRYRRLGLPVTSAPMESLLKQMNARVKGTEMFWDDPEGAESILHIRAAALSEDGRLDDYLATRPGYPFLRRSTLTNLSA